MMKRGLSKTALLIFLLATLILLDQKDGYGWFATGQDADILLSGIDFDNTGGALLFNHPMNIATDGTRLLLADTRNNRILIWNSLPGGNVEPDLVLGQQNFTTNGPGTDMSGLNWPVGVATADGKVVVADTYNDRILIWNTFPATNNQKADLYLKGKNPDDGTDRFGTPGTIGTDGDSYLVIGDHNPKNESAAVGNFFWNSFPTTDNQPYDFFIATVCLEIHTISKWNPSRHRV